MTLYRATPWTIEKVNLEGFVQQTQQGETYIAVKIPQQPTQQSTQQPIQHSAQIQDQPTQQYYDNGFKEWFYITAIVAGVVCCVLATGAMLKMASTQPYYHPTPARY